MKFSTRLAVAASVVTTSIPCQAFDPAGVVGVQPGYSIAISLLAIAWGCHALLSDLKSGGNCDADHDGPFDAAARVAQESADTGGAAIHLADPRPTIDLGVVMPNGLRCSIEAELAGFNRATGIRHSFIGDAVALDSAGPIEQMLLFTLQRSLEWISRHGAATEIRVALTLEFGELHLLIHDNGIGIDAARICCTDGLEAIHGATAAAGGSLAIRFLPDCGSTLLLAVPVAQPTVSG